MPTYTLQEFPKATVAIGAFTNKDYKNVFNKFLQLDEIFRRIYGTVKKGSETVPALVPALPFAKIMVTATSILVKIVDAVESFYTKVQTTEEKIFDVILEGKMKALKANLENLQDSNTSEEQKLSETVSAITNLHELLPIFSRKDSILREKYYIGGPLFVNFCVILKWVSLFAEQMPKYNPSGIPGLKKEYQEVLIWFRNKCIGSRLASCSLKTKTFGFTTRDWERHSTTKSTYYEGQQDIKWEDHDKDLGGKGWLFDCGSSEYNIVDKWDRRGHLGMEVDKLETSSYSDSSSERLRRDLLMEYRNGVETTMLEYFNKGSMGRIQSV